MGQSQRPVEESGCSPPRRLCSWKRSPVSDAQETAASGWQASSPTPPSSHRCAQRPTAPRHPQFEHPWHGPLCKSWVEIRFHAPLCRHWTSGPPWSTRWAVPPTPSTSYKHKYNHVLISGFSHPANLQTSSALLRSDTGRKWKILVRSSGGRLELMFSSASSSGFSSAWSSGRSFRFLVEFIWAVDFTFGTTLKLIRTYVKRRICSYSTLFSKKYIYDIS